MYQENRLWHMMRPVAALCWAILLLAGCGTDTVTDVVLATVAVEPTNTPAPTATPDPRVADLVNTATKDFLGTVVSFNYPAEWTETQRGQFFFVNSPDGPGMSIFIQLSSRLDVDDNMEAMAPTALVAHMQWLEGGNFTNPASVPAPGEPHSFSWGEHDAALNLWQDSENAVQGSNIAVMDTSRDRYIVISTATASDQWAAHEPTWLAMLGTLTLDGAALPGDELATAYQTARTTDSAE